jgi:hypothetical protein
LVLKFDNILNISGHIIIFDSEQYVLFTLSIIPKTVLHHLTTVTGIDSMDFGKSQEMCTSEYVNNVVRRVLWFTLAGNSVSFH